MGHGQIIAVAICGSGRSQSSQLAAGATASWLTKVDAVRDVGVAVELRLPRLAALRRGRIQVILAVDLERIRIRPGR